MKRALPLALFLLLTASGFARGAGDALPARAMQAADHAERQYDDAQVALLAELVRYETVNKEGVANAENPAFRAFARHVEQRARDLGLDFTDYGAVLVVELGDAEDRLGVVTHGDVQPADATKWRRSPFELDSESEPGRLIGRGTEDDKAPIATAMYAMKAIKDLGLPMKRRIELIIGLTEESDHAPFLKVLERYPPPQLNVGIDANYPVVVAEKGWGGVWVTLPATGGDEDRGPAVESFEGGAFLSQVPEDARIVIARADANLVKRVRERARNDASGMSYRFEQDGERFVIQAKGRATHSSEPEHGINALAHAAALLDGESLVSTPAGLAVDFVNALVGTGLYGKRFGDVAYSHPFMGPLTMNLATLRATEDGIELGINVRAPAGKTTEQLDADLRAAIREWSSRRDLPMPAVRSQLNAAYLPDQPAQVEPLLAVFRHYTGIRDAEPISIGGGTFARLLPKAVNFGPSMPGAPYTGHSEHEFITREQMSLNLRMYTAMLAWLATDPPR